MKDKENKREIARAIWLILAIFVQVLVFGMMYFAVPRFVAFYELIYEVPNYHWCTAVIIGIPGWVYLVAMVLAIGVVIGKECVLHTTKASVASSIACIVVGILIFFVFFAAVMATYFRDAGLKKTVNLDYTTIQMQADASQQHTTPDPCECLVNAGLVS